MRKRFLFTSILTSFLLITFQLSAQVGISNNNSQPDPSAGLDVKFNNKGLLPPRMTTLQRDAISAPAEGLLIFNLTTGCFNYYLGGSWKSFCGVSEPTFQCGMKMADSQDGKLYNTVKIGTQCWMAQNLNVGTKILGSEEQANNSIIEKYCYNDDENNCDTYGGLYQWNEAMQYSTTPGVQGICPIGWHLPTDAEWTTLTTYLGGVSIAGGKMKESGTSHWASPNTGATNSSGFTTLPGGYLGTDHNFHFLFEEGFLWSSSQADVTNAWCRYLQFDTGSVGRGSDDKTYGFPVRCLQN